MQKSLSPIILFTYNRPNHTLRVLNALKNNNLADKSVLHIYVDGPKKDSTEENIKNIKLVHDIIKSDRWCGEVNYHISNQNIGCRDSILNGISEIISQYGKSIILEDDIVTSPGFLTFMNSALNFYENRKSVFSISGWSYPPNKLKIPMYYKYDVYVSQRLLNWGWGTWLDRWQQVNWNWDFVPEFVKFKQEVEAFNRGGEDLTAMLLDMHNKKIDAWDVQFAFEQFRNHAISIVPCHSLTDNIGLDGSGMHCTSESGLRNDINLQLDKINFLDTLYQDKQIINGIYSIYYKKKRSIFKKILNRVSRNLLGHNLFYIKGKVLH